MVTKKCPACAKQKQLSEFAKNSRKADGRQSVCRACKKKYDASHYRRNRKAQQKRNEANRKKYQAELDEIKSTSGCKYCGENDPCCLDFHHRNAEEKYLSVSTMLVRCSREKRLLEIAKCDVVCANCHRKLHARRPLSSIGRASDS